jgi:hypothetical protein
VRQLPTIVTIPFVQVLPSDDSKSVPWSPTTRNKPFLPAPPHSDAAMASRVLSTAASSAGPIRRRFNLLFIQIGVWVCRSNYCDLLDSEFYDLIAVRCRLHSFSERLSAYTYILNSGFQEARSLRGQCGLSGRGFERAWENGARK